MEEIEDVIPLDDIDDEIKEWLYDMEDYGYDFRFININSLEDEPYQRLKKCRRKVYLRYECDSCVEDGKPKRWTSILGVFEV